MSVEQSGTERKRDVRENGRGVFRNIFRGEGGLIHIRKNVITPVI